MKNFNRLSLAISVLGFTLIAFSFIPDMEIWKEFFQYEMKHGWECYHGSADPVKYRHWHWNYRGWVWFLTGLILFIVQVIRIVVIFQDADFKPNDNEK